MFSEIPIRFGRYAPGKLVSPKAEPLRWAVQHQDAAGNVTGGLTCPECVELRFAKPGGSTSFQLTLRGRLEAGEGSEWTIVVPAERMGTVRIPEGFAAEQSMLGAIYRLSQPHHLRVLVDQKLDLPGLTFTVQLL